MDFIGKFWVDSAVHDADALELLIKRMGQVRRATCGVVFKEGDYALMAARIVSSWAVTTRFRWASTILGSASRLIRHWTPSSR